MSVLQWRHLLQPPTWWLLIFREQFLAGPG